MRSVREPAVAGAFYPADPVTLRSVVTEYLKAARNPDTSIVPKALIVPHAGYIYSGPVAASGYVYLDPVRDRIRRVVLLGPAHRYPVDGMALPSASWFRTPLGDIKVDAAASQRIQGLPQVVLSDLAHAPEHSLEVQLPFLQVVLDRFTLVPLVVGRATPAEVAQVLDLLWGGEETLIVVSSDLSHYEPYAVAQRLDEAVSRAIEALDPDRISPHQACGYYPVRGLLVAARQKGLQARTVDLRNSGDTAGPKGEVVGYGAYVFHPSVAG